MIWPVRHSFGSYLIRFEDEDDEEWKRWRRKVMAEGAEARRLAQAKRDRKAQKRLREEKARQERKNGQGQADR